MKLGKYFLAMMMALGFANVTYADDCCNEEMQEEVTAQTQDETPETAEETSEAAE